MGEPDSARCLNVIEHMNVGCFGDQCILESKVDIFENHCLMVSFH